MRLRRSRLRLKALDAHRPADPREPRGRAAAERALGAVVHAALALPLVFGVGACAIAMAFSPEEVASGAFYEWFGFTAPSCPGCPMCGMSRAFSALLHGDPSAAIALNAMVVVVFPAVLLASGACALGIVQLAREPLRLRSRPSANK